MRGSAGVHVLDLAKECLALSEAGLKRRGFLDSDGRDEARYLEPLQEIVARGIDAGGGVAGEVFRARGAGRSTRCLTEYAY